MHFKLRLYRDLKIVLHIIKNLRNKRLLNVSVLAWLRDKLELISVLPDRHIGEVLNRDASESCYIEVYLILFIQSQQL